MISKFAKISSHLFLILLLLSKPAFAILGGQLVTPGEFPERSTVSLFNADPWGAPGGMCTGTLVARDLVLTAAHCLIKFDEAFIKKPYDISDKPELRASASKIRVNFGNFRDVDLKTAWPQMPTVSDFKILPNFLLSIESKSAYNDLALVKLSDQAPVYYLSAPLLRDPSKLAKGMSLSIAGFGRDNENLTGILNSFSSKIYDPLDAKGNLLMEKTGGGENGGDSGGPAYASIDSQFQVVGVVSGYDGDYEIPRYTPIAPHIEWLKAAAIELGSQL